MKVLVINCGSSSLKYQVLNMDDESLLCKGLVEKIGIEGSMLTHTKIGADKFVVEAPMKNHTDAIQYVLDALVDKDHGVLASMSELGAVGHRVLHGGDKFTASCVVDEACKQAIRDCFPWDPSTIPPTSWASRLARSSCPTPRRSQYSIPPSIRPCLPRASCTRFPMSITRSTP